MEFDAALPGFFAESYDLLDHMEEALLRIEQAPGDTETLNTIFRAAHTIKGNAGLFGFQEIVAFTHVAENLLDRVRSGAIAVDATLVALLLSCADHVRALLGNAQDNRGSPPEMLQRGQSLTQQLQIRCGDSEVPRQTTVPAQYEMPHTKSGGGEVETDLWHISLRFGLPVFQNGMDPLPFIRYLNTLGTIRHVVTRFDTLPDATSLDPELCYLGFEISLESAADKAAIENVFTFVSEQCQIRILPPHSKIAQYLELIAQLPGAEMRVGEMLVRCGTLTQKELDAALALQNANPTTGKPPPLGQLLVDAKLVAPPVVAAALDKQRQVKEAKVNEAQLIRVDAGKLDRLINLVGELIIAGASTTLAAQRAGVTELLEATAMLSRLVEDVRDSALTLRMVQIGATFHRFQRVVRDVSAELGKEIDLVISGADTELDKTVVEKIADPLTHLVRNAMDHGIEPVEVRLQRGKPQRGTLRLNAFYDSGNVVIEVRDDGGGLNRDRILAKAVERGLVNADDTLTESEIYNLIFEPGFSTAEVVSNLSGRGVGMDVVRRDIQALRGTVELDSSEGQGSTVRIRLPLTLAIIDGFLVGVGAATYVIPLDMVVECIELSAVDFVGRDSHHFSLRGEVFPFCRLREHFNVPGKPPRRENIVIVRSGNHKVGLVVDRLMGEFQTVVRPLGKVFGKIQCVGGFTILGSGDVSLILDLPSLLRQAASAQEIPGNRTRVLAADQALGASRIDPSALALSAPH